MEAEQSPLTPTLQLKETEEPRLPLIQQKPPSQLLNTQTQVQMKQSLRHKTNSDFNREQQQAAMMRSTDFASRGLYKETTSGGTKSQSIFKECANLRLAGSTFDAKHMDRFLKTEFAMGSSPSGVKQTQTVNRFSPTQRMNQNLVRQSCSFTSLDRDHMGQQRIYIDQYDGPSSLIKRDEHKTIKEMNGGEKNLYDHEREQLQTLDRDNQRIMKLLYEDNGMLKSPKQRQIEIQQTKNEIKRFQENKQNQMFVNKRDRVIKSGWRHGIVGVENTDDPGTDIYRGLQEQRNYYNSEKEAINNRRYNKLVKCGEVASQIEFARSGMFNECRKNDKIIDMYPDWKNKRVSPQRFQDTHKHLFVHLDGRFNPIRASKLRLEEKRERPFNIISGEPDNII